MRAFFKYFFASLLALFTFIFLFFILFAIIGAVSSASSDDSISSNSVLTIDLSDDILEQSKENEFGFLSGEPQSITGLNDILASIKQAKTDDKIKGMYIKLSMSNNGWASLEELREAIVDFKESKKFTLCYGEVCDQKSYYIATACDKVYLNPSGAMEFKGLAINAQFFKGTIDKLDIKTEAFHCGKFKGAHEPYSYDKFSEPNRFQLKELLNDMYAEFLQAVSQKSGIDTAILAKMANDGAIKFPKDAVASKMIDGAIYSDSIENILKKNLSLKEKEKISFVSMSEYASTLTVANRGKDKIAILYAAGSISDGEGGAGGEGIFSKDMVRDIRKISRDEKIKAVVLRINSPGGSALASEVIYHELEQLHKKKPIIVSMGNYAASGGYYMACASDSILADKNTLTGSIGVVGVLFNIGDMMKNKLGITNDQIKTAQFADFPNLTRPMTEVERTWIQGYLDTTYNLFKTRVANARKLTMQQVEDLAQGHVYSGKMAKELNLIDGFGNTETAIKSAANLANLNEYSIVEYPKPRDQFSEIMSTITGKKREEAAVKRFLGQDYAAYVEIQKLRNHQNQILAQMPWQIDIK
jgi:protease-4